MSRAMQCSAGNASDITSVSGSMTAAQKWVIANIVTKQYSRLYGYRLAVGHKGTPSAVEENFKNRPDKK